MNGISQKELVWPPTREDLGRLYVDERLSAMKIAQRYGLKYASPKTAESTILYHLKRAGIDRRDSADHIRKTDEVMVDEWVRRYKAGESLKKIAANSVTPVTVWNHLRRREVPMRDKVEAQIRAVTRHQRLPFDGSVNEIAYLVGFAKGDLYVTTHGRGLRAKTSTSHPAMSALFHRLLDRYGHVRESPRPNELTGYEWSLECDLHSSLGFLRSDTKLEEVLTCPDTFLDFLSGFFDAEGSVYFHKKSLHGSFELSISSIDGTLLEKIAGTLRERGYSPMIRLARQVQNRGVKNGGDSIWRLSLWRWVEVRGLLLSLKPRHSEKTEKIRIALKLEYRPSEANRRKVISEWDALRFRIAQERKVYIDKAELLLGELKTVKTC